MKVNLSHFFKKQIRDKKVQTDKGNKSKVSCQSSGKTQDIKTII